jgi:hypothetical protein
MDNGTDLKKCYPGRQVDFTVAVLGNTTSAPTIPADGTFTAATSTFPNELNSVDRTTAGAPTRTGTGVYTVTYKHLLKNVIPSGPPAVLAAGGSPTSALDAIITSIVPATRVVTIKVFAPNGTATDLGVNDILIICLTGRAAS